MSVEVLVPAMGESVKTATVSRWLKNPGDFVREDEPVVELDSDKATMELPAPAAGVLEAQLVSAGDEVTVGQLIARIAPGAAPAPAPAGDKVAPGADKPATDKPGADKPGADKPAADGKKAEPPKAAAKPEAVPVNGSQEKAAPASPAVRQAMREAGVDATDVHGSGKGGRVTRADVAAAVARPAAPAAPEARPGGDEPVEVVPMTNLVGSSRVDLQACKLEYSIVSPK